MLEPASARTEAWATPLIKLPQERTQSRACPGRVHPPRCVNRLCRWPLLGAAALLLVTSPAWGAEKPAYATPPAIGQNLYGDTIFQHLGDADGLSTSVISAIAQDGDGFLWVGTQGGLARWDGYRFRRYQAVPGAAGALPNNSVQALYGDPRGRLWIGTDSGLARYDRERDRFTPYSSHAGDVSRAGVSSIVTDGTDGLWVGTPNGLAHFDIVHGRYTEFRPGGPGAAALARSSILSLLRDENGVLWIGTADGLFRGDPSGDPTEKSFTEISLPSSSGAAPSVMSLCGDSLGHLWIGTNSHGALVLDLASGAVREVRESAPVTMPSGERTTLHDEQVQRIVEASPGVMWLGTLAHGIVAVDARSFKTHRITHDVAIPTSLADDAVAALFRDRSGVMWVGTNTGINQTDPTRSGVMTFYSASSHKGRLADDVVSVLAAPDGPLWLGLYRLGVDVFDRSGTRLRALRPDPTHPETALPKGIARVVAAGPNGTVYIGTEHGVYRADSDGRHLRRISCGTPQQPFVTALLDDADTLWVGARAGLWKLAPTSAGAAVLRHVPLPEALANPQVTAIVKGPDGYLWIGTWNGLERVDPKTLAGEHILPNAEDPTALGSEYVSSILVDHQQRVWISTFGSGISLFTGRDASGHFRFHRLMEGLPNANVDALREGPDHHIWASTDDGIAEIDPESLKIEVLQRPDGVAIHNYVNNSGAVSQSSGTLLFGGLGGLTAIQPNQLNHWNYIPPVMVTDARIGGRAVPANPFNDGPNHPITIRPDENSLMVGFAALDFSAPGRNHYAYRLDGFDRQWIPTDPTRRLASYTNLPPGTYTLELRGSNRLGQWGPTRSITIRILPAWYQTILARILFTLGSLLVFFGGFQIGTAYLRARQRELKRQVALRTAELENLTEELKMSQQKLEQLAYSDSLTGLPNRRMFNECFRRLLALKQRQHGLFALLVIDLDNFKEINDTYGHDAGDAVLIEVSRRLEAMVRQSDCFARVGGDEFVMLVAEPTEIAAVESVCSRIVDSFIAPVDFRGVTLHTTASIGAAVYPEGGETQDNLYRSADIALYQAKRRGGNRWDLQAHALEMTGQEPSCESGKSM
jgi:diguanylate cyclase (GGDEF)-like protein